jgi:hypothetical protein
MAKTRSRFFRDKPLTLSLQRMYMTSVYPEFVCALRHPIATWTGELKPTAMSATYTVEVRYELSARPSIKVLSPELELHPDFDKLPHYYHDKGSLCLHVGSDWNGNKIIALTVMQWISGWLYFYEVWRQTGYWLGGGTHDLAPQHRSQ